MRAKSDIHSSLLEAPADELEELDAGALPPFLRAPAPLCKDLKVS